MSRTFYGFFKYAFAAPILAHPKKLVNTYAQINSYFLFDRSTLPRNPLYIMLCEDSVPLRQKVQNRSIKTTHARAS